MDLEAVGIGSEYELGSGVGEDGGERGKDLGMEESYRSSEKVDRESDGVIGVVEGSELCATEVGSSSHEKKINVAVEKVNDSPLEGTVTSPTVVVTGKELRTWRRIRRVVGKEAGLDGDSCRVLKRGHEVEPEPTKSQGENKQKSDNVEGKSSVDSWVVGNLVTGSKDFGDLGFGSFEYGNLGNRYSNECENFGSSSNNRINLGSGSSLQIKIEAFDSELAEQLSSGVGFVLGADSDNSEDRSSKSSTAASAPKHKQHKGHRGKGSFDSNKKFREDRSQFRGKNSDLSCKCDSRNSNDVVSEKHDSTSSNTKHGVDFVNYDEEIDDEAQVSEAGPAVYSKENGQQDEHLSKDEIYDDDVNATKDDGREEDENFDPHNDQNLFHESIFLLQAAQEALEKEIEIFEEIGKTSGSFSGNSPIYSYLEESETSSFTPLESKINFLNKKVRCLQSKLLQSSTILNARELKLLELEDILHNAHLDSKKTTAVNDPDPVFIEKRVEEMELELEGLFTKKLDVEIECFTLRRAIKSWAALVKEKFTLFDERKSLSEDYYDQLILKLSDAEGKVLMLKKKEKELEASCQELLGTDGVMFLQNRVCKFSLCFFLQLMMLCVGLWLFLKQLFTDDSYESNSLPT